MIKPYLCFICNKKTGALVYRADVTSVEKQSSTYRVTFQPGKVYNYSFKSVLVLPLLSSRSSVLVSVDGQLKEGYEFVDHYGQYVVLRQGDRTSYPIELTDRVEVYEPMAPSKSQAMTLQYFQDLLRAGQAGEINTSVESDVRKAREDIRSAILSKSLDQIEKKQSQSVFRAYMSPESELFTQEASRPIYPFGCNESQRKAVEVALSHRFSIVEGPPGTGKTQTILNLIANLLMQNKTVAIVSNNNSAVFNVKEKLEKHGYGMLVASLGNRANKEDFFEQRSFPSVDPDWALSDAQKEVLQAELPVLEQKLRACFDYRNRLAKLRAELSDITTEYHYYCANNALSAELKAQIDPQFKLRLTPKKALRLMSHLSSMKSDGLASF